LETIQIDKIPKENKLGTDGQTDEFKKGEVPTRQSPSSVSMRKRRKKRESLWLLPNRTHGMRNSYAMREIAKNE